MNVKAKNYFPIAIIAVLGAALLFAAPISVGNFSVFAQEAQKEEPTKENGAEAVTVTAEEEEEVAVEEPQVLPAPTEEVQVVEPRPDITQPDNNLEGNAFFEVEQSLGGGGVSAECLVELDQIAVKVFENSIVVNAPAEVEQAIEAGAQEVAAEVPVDNAEVPIAIEEIIVEVEEANNTEVATEVAAAVEATVNETTVTEAAAENAIIEEIIEITVTEEPVNEAVLGGVEAVLNGSATAEEAVTQVETNLNETFAEVEVTPEIVAEAVETVQSENAVVEELGGDATESAAVEPTKEEEVVVEAPVKEDPVTVVAEEEPATAVAPEVAVVVEETISENVEEIAQEAGTDAGTVRDLLAQAQTAIAAAQAQIG